MKWLHTRWWEPKFESHVAILTLFLSGESQVFKYEREYWKLNSISKVQSSLRLGKLVYTVSGGVTDSWLPSSFYHISKVKSTLGG